MKASTDSMETRADESSDMLKELEIASRAVGEHVHDQDWAFVKRLHASLAPDMDATRTHGITETRELGKQHRPRLDRLQTVLSNEEIDRVPTCASLRARALGHVNDVLRLLMDNPIAAERLLQRIEGCSPALAAQGAGLESVWRRDLRQLAATPLGIRLALEQLDRVLGDLRARLKAGGITESTVLAAGPEKPAGLVVRRPPSASWPDRDDLPPAA